MSAGQTVGGQFTPWVLPVDAAGNVGRVAVGGVVNISQVLKTRPANVTPYTAKDAISASAGTQNWAFDLARVAGGSGYIVKVRLQTDQEAEVWRGRIHLFNVAPTPIADNSPVGLLFADRQTYLGYIDLPALGTEDTGVGDCAVSQATDVRFAFKCDAADTQLFGLLETLDAFTPASGAKYMLAVTAEVY